MKQMAEEGGPLGPPISRCPCRVFLAGMGSHLIWLKDPDGSGGGGDRDLGGPGPLVPGAPGDSRFGLGRC